MNYAVSQMSSVNCFITLPQPPNQYMPRTNKMIVCCYTTSSRGFVCHELSTKNTSVCFETSPKSCGRYIALTLNQLKILIIIDNNSFVSIKWQIICIWPKVFGFHEHKLPSSAQAQAQSQAWGWDSLNLIYHTHPPPTRTPSDLTHLQQEIS